MTTRTGAHHGRRRAGLLAGSAWVLAGVVAAMALTGCSSDAPAPPAATRAIELPGPDGAALAGRTAGSGSTAVVLVHGASTTMASWYSVMQPLADAGYRVIAFDSRGVGESAGEPSTDVAARAEDVAAVIGAARADGATDVVLAGSSLGSLAATRAAADAAAGGTRDRVAGLVMVSPPAVPPELTAAQAPIVVITSADDTGPTATARTIARTLGVEPIVVNGGIHGADLFRSHPEAIRDLVRFITTAAPPDAS